LQIAVSLGDFGVFLERRVPNFIFSTRIPALALKREWQSQIPLIGLWESAGHVTLNATYHAQWQKL